MELKHFCLQYYEWQEEANSIKLYVKVKTTEIRGTDISDPTFDAAERLLKLRAKMELVERACSLASDEISNYIFEAVTKDITYTALEARGVPFGRDYFYDRLHKFFYILSELRD